MHRTLLTCAFSLLAACATDEADHSEEVASESTHCATSEPILIPNNPTTGPNMLYGSFAQTWRYFGSDQCRQPYDFNRALAKLGWPLTTPRDNGSDLIQMFERVKMNAGGGCEYGACLSFAGIEDATKTFNAPITEGLTNNCNHPGLMRRSVDCLPPELRQVYEANGGLAFYGFPISTVQNCGWWDVGPVGGRECVYTERAKLGRFPENQGNFRWQGEALGLKLVLSGQVPGAPELRGCDNFHISAPSFNGVTGGSFTVRNDCGEQMQVSYNTSQVFLSYSGPNGNSSAVLNINPVTRQVSIASMNNPFPAKLFVARWQLAEAAGRVDGGIGPRCLVSAIALVGGVFLAFTIPPPAGQLIGTTITGAGLGGLVGFCPGQ